MGGPARRRGTPKWTGPSAAPSRDRETAELVAAALDEEPVDLATLRKLAVVRGLGSHALRARAWPLLLGARAAPDDVAELGALAAAGHADAAVVECDVERSLWSFTKGWDDDARAAARADLRRVINAAISAGAGAGVRYYQGLHDVASVLLLVTGSDVAAFRLLRRLTTCQLRDCTRSTLDAALETLELLPPVLAAADPLVARRVAGIPPHYALPWLLTWFARAAPDLEAAARLFDLFAAAPPVAPVYVAAAALAAARPTILAAPPDADPAEMHALLSRLDVLGGGPASPSQRVDALAKSAVTLLKKVPPGPLLARARARGAARAATAALAKLEGGSWAVADIVDDAEWRAAAARDRVQPPARVVVAGGLALLAAFASAALARSGGA